MGVPSEIPRSCVPLSACVGWCVRLPEVLFPLGWCVRLPDVLSPLVFHFLIVPLIVFHCLPSCLPVSPCRRLCAIVSHCLPHVCLCWMVCPPSEVLSPHCLPLSPRIGACVGWCLRLGSYPPSRGLVPHCLPTRVPVLDVVPAFPRSCLRLSPIVSPHVCLCWMVRPPSRGLVSHCLPSCFPVLDGVSAFRGFVSLVSQLASQLVFLLVSQLVSQLVFLLVSLCGGWSDFAFFSNSVLLGVGFLKVSALVLDGVSAFPRSCLLSCLPAGLSSCFPLWRVVLHFFSNSVRLGVLNAFSCHVFDPVPQKHVLNPPTVWGLRWCSLSSISLIPRTELLHCLNRIF